MSRNGKKGFLESCRGSMEIRCTLPSAAQPDLGEFFYWITARLNDDEELRAILLAVKLQIR